MNFVCIFLGICLIEGGFSTPQGEEDELNGENLLERLPEGRLKLMDLERLGSSAIKLKNLIPEDESKSVQDHFSGKLISSIQKIITNLISNPQTMSYLLTLIPTFPPAAIIGSFIMVVLSIFQNPTIMNFLKNVLPDIQSLTLNPNSITIPKYLKDLENVDTDELNFIKEGAKYAAKLVDSAPNTLHLKDLDLNDANISQHPIKLNELSSPEGHNDGIVQSRKKRSLSRDNRDKKTGSKYLRNDGGPIPLRDLI